MLRLIVDLDPVDPSFGLALEEALFTGSVEGDGDALRLWVNGRSVVIGRSQSASSEVDLTRLRALRVPVIRRISGGGAVYHYQGNLNVSLFLRDGAKLGTAPEAYDAIGVALARGLAKHGIDARAEGNVIMVGDRKIAGAAQARRGRGLLYHASLLVSPSPIPIEGLLLAMQGTYRTRGVASHALPIVTAAELAPGISSEGLARTLSGAIARRLGEELKEGGCTRRELERAERLRAAKYGRDEWNLSR